MKKKILFVLVAVLVGIQFFRPARNTSGESKNDISTKYPVPEEVASLLKVACNDCHSNKTVYPWYSNIQPLGWWLNSHITDGKRHLNFSEFTSLRIAIQNHKFEETIEMVKEGEMPLESYTMMGLHSEAKLSDAQRELLVKWAETQMDTLKAHYPPDSLKMPRRPPPAPGK
ncbi:MAG: heme-binding domain-containing protein [Bacteroidia bacterium]|nr:heme-binding domain-containing protein [Bacteroidia bacterium]